jgi:hypothetical protein
LLPGGREVVGSGDAKVISLILSRVSALHSQLAVGATRTALTTDEAPGCQSGAEKNGAVIRTLRG